MLPGFNRVLSHHRSRHPMPSTQYLRLPMPSTQSLCPAGFLPLPRPPPYPLDPSVAWPPLSHPQYGFCQCPPIWPASFPLTACLRPLSWTACLCQPALPPPSPCPAHPWPPSIPTARLHPPTRPTSVSLPALPAASRAVSTSP